MNNDEYLKFIEDWKENNKELIKSGKCKKVFLECLNKKDKRIDWKNTIGINIYFIHGNIKGKLKIIGYNASIIFIEYNNKQFRIFIGNLKKGNLGNILGIKTSEFKIDIGTRFQDKKRDIIIMNREVRTKYNQDGSFRRYEKWYKYHCNICGWDECWAEESHLISQRQGCSVCNNKTIVKGINDIATTHPCLVKYFVNVEDTYTHSCASNDKVVLKCLDCGKEKEMIINNLFKRGFNCSICSDKISYGEKFVINILNQLQLDFQTQLSKAMLSWCQDYRYDFYFELSGEKYVIETNGLQHYKECTGNWKKKLKEQQLVDKLKKELALSNGIKEENYIVIDCRYSELEFIKQNILNSNLAKVLNFSKIDWLKAEEFTCSNLVKVACDYKKSNPNITTTEIGELMGYSRDSIVRWLKKGKKIGWCSYTNSNYKLIGMFKDGILLEMFESATEIMRQSEKLFGIKLICGEISKICNINSKRHGNQYKGFTFKYVSDLSPEEYIKYNIEEKLKELEKSA